MDREPIFWTTTQHGYNDVDRERVYERDGEIVRERFPQRGHDGDYDDHKPYPRGERFVNMVRHEGHVVAMVVTCAAADLDSSSSFGQCQRAMARYYGWYRPGQCPLAMILNGELDERQLADKTLIGQEPCRHGTYDEAHPCKHSVAELEGRRKRNVKLEAKRSADYKSDTDKLIEANRSDSAALVEALTAAIAAKAGVTLPFTPEPPPTPPPPAPASKGGRQ